jgi:hypothetical protein
MVWVSVKVSSERILVVLSCQDMCQAKEVGVRNRWWVSEGEAAHPARVRRKVKAARGFIWPKQAGAPVYSYPPWSKALVRLSCVRSRNPISSSVISIYLESE